MARLSRRKSSVSARARQAREKRNLTQKNLSILRKQGLIGKDEFRGKPGGGAYKIIRKYKDVIEGKAVAIKPNTKLVPRHIRTAFKERNGKLVIPKVEGTVSTKIVREKGKTIVKRTRRTARGLIREQVVPVQSGEAPLPPGKLYRVTMPNWQSSKYFINEETLENFLGFSAGVREFADIAIVDQESIAHLYGL